MNIGGFPVGLATASAAINVDKPTSKLTITTHSVRIGPGPVGNAMVFGLLGNTTPSPGIDFIGSVTTPAGWPQGKWNWVQTIVSSRKFTSASNGANFHSGNGTTTKLDKSYPYDPTPYSGNSVVAGSCAADGSSNGNTNDTPSAPIIGLSRIEITESFETYIMFKSAEADSCYVPLLKANWSWGGIASSADSFTNVSSPIKIPTTLGVGVECSTHPQWSVNSLVEPVTYP